VINVITLDAKETHGALVSAGGGNVDQGFLNARYGGNAKGVNYRVYAKGFTRGPEDHPDQQNFDDWRSFQSGFRMDWNTSGHGTFNLQGDIYTERVGERVQATSYTAPYSQVIDGNADLSGGNITGRWEKNIRHGNDIQLQIYYDRSSRWEPNLADIRNTFDIDFIQHLQLPARNKISLGLGGRVGPVDNPVVVSGLTFDPTRRTDYLATGFFQDEIGLVDHHLTLTLGTKLLRTNFTTGISWEPSGRLIWTPDEKQSYWAAYTLHCAHHRTPKRISTSPAIRATSPTGHPFLRGSSRTRILLRNSSTGMKRGIGGYSARMFLSMPQPFTITITISSAKISSAHLTSRQHRRRHICCFPRNSETAFLQTPRE
jgi:iron complex outermembrane receptor protein